MKVRLISLGTKIPNLALMKLSAFHKKRVDEVSLDEPEPDIVYVSSPFSRFKDAYDYSKMFPDAAIEYGGYGFNLKKLPYEIEHMMPDYSIFNCRYSMGYTTRGCIRHCKKPPCIVPIAEGSFRRNSPIEEFHNPAHKKIMLLDNNILADKEWFFRNTDYLIGHDLTLIEHGFDIRLIDGEIAKQIARVKFERQIHFALDSMSYADEAVEGVRILGLAGIRPRRLMFYLYEKDDFNDLYRRFELILSMRCDPFIMPDIDASYPVKRFARYVNKRIYKICDWKSYKKKGWRRHASMTQEPRSETKVKRTCQLKK